jgi:hypothetical protein
MSHTGDNAPMPGPESPGPDEPPVEDDNQDKD